MKKTVITALLLSVIFTLSFCVPTFAQKNIVHNDNSIVQSNATSQSIGTDQSHSDDQVEPRFIRRLILKLIEEGTEYFIKLSKKGSIIKKADFKVKTEHIFSKDHKDKGIMKLGKNEKAILKKFRDMIENADEYGVLKDNTNNQIRTIINGYKVEVRAYVKDGELKNLNAFLVTGEWPNTNFGNIVYLVPDYDD
ncbi:MULTISPECIES: polymorphic toxin type 35 domain-containing protein [Brevibacillus]|jgi:hypothetical protein|uniref:polymorphic toxin type 35 domain-containing protein n=1 Tax=Brevibacillus TaxID=55080 RepID=UPI000684F114|nr:MULTISPECIES: polymorphic toxin type 35 domain-containing protein [Brevibacillus]TRY26938.1 hypothetical protein FOI68_04985 [Brevibacillus sp. LEMMJ03]